MFCGFRKVYVAAGAALFALGGLSASSAVAGTIQNTSPATIDGWTISWGTGVGLVITQDTNANQVDVEKTATFTAPNQGYQITFSPTVIPSDGVSAATQFVIPDETIVNHTGSSFSAFSFILVNKTSTLATFDSVGRTFIPPTGPGYNFSTVELSPGNTILTYTGTQGDGVTSFWGNGDPSSVGDNLLIDAPAGSDFSLKELSSSGSVVPLPAAAWQSLTGLAGLALFGLRRQIKQRRLA